MPLAETLPTQCQQLKRGYGECKRGMIDMRKRFRGNKPVSVSTELEAGGDPNKGYQLYGGAPAVKDFNHASREPGPAEGGEKLEK